MLTTQIIFSFFKLQKSFMKLAIMFWYGPNLDNVDIFEKDYCNCVRRFSNDNMFEKLLSSK